MKKVTLSQTKRKLDMNSKLLEYLKNNKMFKLVCGAGNENEEDVEKLVELYPDLGFTADKEWHIPTKENRVLKVIVQN